jgi:hypothetical protein
VDWTSGTVYDYYSDTSNMISLNNENLLSRKFYVRNKFDQVFKCLWNANGAISTSEPQFLPGTYDPAFIFYGSDGYKWKYLYSIDNGIKQKFLDVDWIPTPLADIFPNPITPSTGLGGVDVINVTNSGSGYVANGVTVVITGDGSGAEAVPSVNAAGYITDVTVTNSGSNYTNADISFSVPPQYPTPNTVATAIAPIAPVGGHGFDPISEFGCNHVMISVEFDKGEERKVPTDLTFHQIGMILNPIASSTYPRPANESVYDTTTHLVVSAGINDFVSGQTIYQGPSSINPTYSATVASFDIGNNVVKVINTFGTPRLNYPLLQDANGPIPSATRTLLQEIPPDFVLNSGYMLYIENRSGVTRSPDSIEQFRLVLKF